MPAQTPITKPQIPVTKSLRTGTKASAAKDRITKPREACSICTLERSMESEEGEGEDRVEEKEGGEGEEKKEV
ncbi:hypothetical protein V491_02470 [Pseudogymnoascus sp. VKM F-3775]|nr:hypothetical protein V491_02470 [Pseudogymnoascus sp. VKM F-3775]